MSHKGLTLLFLTTFVHLVLAGLIAAQDQEDSSESGSNVTIASYTPAEGTDDSPADIQKENPSNKFTFTGK